jgi:hypothetical protein
MILAWFPQVNQATKQDRPTPDALYVAREASVRILQVRVVRGPSILSPARDNGPSRFADATGEPGSFDRWLRHRLWRVDGDGMTYEGGKATAGQ